MKIKNPEKKQYQAYAVVYKDNNFVRIYENIGPAKSYISSQPRYNMKPDEQKKVMKKYKIVGLVAAETVISGEDHFNEKRVKELKKEIKSLKSWANSTSDISKKIELDKKIDQYEKELYDILSKNIKTNQAQQQGSAAPQVQN